MSSPDRKNLQVGSSISSSEGVPAIRGDHLDQRQASGFWIGSTSEELHTWASAIGIAVLILTHTRKMKAGDPKLAKWATLPEEDRSRPLREASSGREHAAHGSHRYYFWPIVGNAASDSD